MNTSNVIKFRNAAGEIREIKDIPTGSGVLKHAGDGIVQVVPATASQIVRGDGSGVDLTKSSVGLGNVTNDTQFCASNNNVMALWTGSLELQESVDHSPNEFYISVAKMFKYHILRFAFGSGNFADFTTDGTSAYISVYLALPSYSGSSASISAHTCCGTINRATGVFEFHNMYYYSSVSGETNRSARPLVLKGIYGIGFK